MRSFVCLMVGVLAGCASKPQAAVSCHTEPAPVRYEDSASTALVFDPPVSWNQGPIDLSREERSPGAFVSFEGPTITYYWIHTDDLQDSDWGRERSNGTSDRYQRRAIIDKFGTSYR